jgi:hypothetical protein
MERPGLSPDDLKATRSEVLVDLAPVFGKIPGDYFQAEPGQDRAGRFSLQQKGERRPDQCFRRCLLEAETGLELAGHRHDVARLGLAVANSHGEVAV